VFGLGHNGVCVDLLDHSIVPRIHTSQSIQLSISVVSIEDIDIRGKLDIEAVKDPLSDQPI
jgi:hypothetical protein